MEGLSTQEIDRIVRERIRVNRQNVAIMKGLILKHFDSGSGNTAKIIRSAIKDVGPELQDSVQVPHLDAIEVLQEVGDFISWYLNAVEAVWQLVHAGVLLFHGRTDQIKVNVTGNIIADINESGLHYLEWVEPKFFPHTVWKSRCDKEGFSLTDPDLYLNDLLPHVPHDEVREALEESVKCFRAELYMACIVMLGKASEGAWIEFGRALVDFLPRNDSSVKLRRCLEDDTNGFAKQLREIMSHYTTKQAEYASVAKNSDVSLNDLRFVATWSEVLRNARNVVHYGNRPPMPNNYENVATMLLAGAKHLRTLYALHDAARQAIA